MIFYSFWMTILIVTYHLAPHLIELSDFNGGYLRQFFETFGPIALNYFFAVSAYKFFVSEKSCGDKLKKRLVTLIVPYIAWNTIYISLYILQNGFPNIRTVILGYTLTPFDGPLWYNFCIIYVFGNFLNLHESVASAINKTWMANYYIDICGGSVSPCCDLFIDQFSL